MGAALLGYEVFLLWSLLRSSVYALGHFENVALNKTCNMSSLYYGNGPSPYLAVDGKNCNYSQIGFVSTKVEDNPWWEVNLGRPYPVHNITIWARPYLQRRMNGSKITVDGQECYKIMSTPDNPKIPFTCSSGVLNGSVVRVYKVNTPWPPGTDVEDKVINICEVKIFSCSDGYWGSGCDRRCGNCSNSEECDKVTGHCSSCPSNLDPPLCDCRSGSFGPSCAQACSAGCEDVCDKVSGHCTCKPGWLGPACVTECPTGQYGLSCTQNCSVHCDDACDKVTGNCTCKKGFIPPLCSRGEQSGDGSSTTGTVVGAVVGTVCAVVLLVIGAILVIRLKRSRSSRNKEQTSTTAAAHGTRANSSLSQDNRPSDDRNLPPSSQLHSVYEAVEGERDHGYENRTQAKPSADEAIEGPSDELPSVSSALSRDQPYEILDHQPETTYDRPQMYQNTLEHHVYNDLKT